jgi:putative restriction endonuclease
MSQWTRDKLLFAVWKKKEERAPHKPLLIVYALGQLLSEAKAELERRNAVGRFVPEVQELLVDDLALAGDIVSLNLTNHFPDSIHEDILAAVRLDQLQTAKPKRDPKFREDVLRAYGYRCAVCGFDLRLDHVLLALDAAHIRWHQASGPSIAANGLALCSLHHKLFDRGAFSLADDLRVEVSARVNGSNGLIECLLNFHSHRIARPNSRSAAPDPDFIRWHRHEVFHPPVADWADLPIPNGRA